MFNGKMKAVTFSFDDATTQDARLIKILDKYNLKCTFNLNSMRFGRADALFLNGKTVSHVKVRESEVKELYKNHEVAVHSLTHPNLKNLSDGKITCEVEYDRIMLSEMVGYEVVGMAYPGGTGCFDERVADVIKRTTKVAYARSTTSTYNFDLQENLLLFDPTIHCSDVKIFELAEKFIAMKPSKPQLFYIWGHSFDLDINDGWDKFEEFCKLISNREDIFYGTNTECLI